MKEEFKPFDKVLVRGGELHIWKCAFFSHYGEGLYFTTDTNFSYKYCLPFEGNESLAGTVNEPTKPKLKVIRGNEKRGDEVIKMLEDLGGRNARDLNGNSKDDYYYIGENNVITFNNDYYSFFDNYELEILKLPEPKPKLKVIRGDEKRGDEVIALLENLGGNNKSKLKGDVEYSYYYIDECGIIISRIDKSFFFKDYDLEVLELPVKKPKLQVIRGDEERGDEVIAMLKNLGGSIFTNLKGVYGEWYYYVNEEGLIDSRNISSKFFDDYELEIIELLPKKKRWRAENEFIYYYVDSDFHVVNDRDCRDVLDNGRYSCGNYFKTKEEAKIMAEKIKELFKNEENS